MYSNTNVNMEFHCKVLEIMDLTNTEIQIKIIGIIMSVYLMYIQEQAFFYKTEKFYCKKYKGNCEKCKCWSCKKYQMNYEVKNENNKYMGK